ncbi:MAG: hypothetical protein WD696_13640 [Bryobacteraceae bacterium]
MLSVTSGRGLSPNVLNPIYSLSQYQTHVEARILNVEPGAMEQMGLLDHLRATVEHRQPPALPSGVVEGLASDPAAIREVSAEEAEKLREEDSSPPASAAGLQS